jgi:hypothetical protein
MIMYDATTDVRFTPESGRVRRNEQCLLRANSGHSQNDRRKQKDRLVAVSLICFVGLDHVVAA